MQVRPRLSIVTPLLNRSEMLPAALESVAAQGNLSIEHLIVDGGSTDGSREIALKSAAELIDAPGTSIYEAINLGLSRARGEIICLLNSDDRLPAGAVAAAFDVFDKNVEAEFVRGRADTESKSGGAWALEPAPPAVVSKSQMRSVLFGPTNINACFFRRGVVDRVGPFNPAHRVSADREWLARALLKGVRILDTDRLLYIYRSHEGSLTIGADKPARIAWVREHLSFAAAFLSRSDIDPEHRHALRAFLGKETVHLVYLLLAAGNAGAALQTLASSTRIDPLWPAHALGPLGAIIVRRLSPA